MLKTEAARLQAEAAGQWTYYQTKGIKAAVQEASRAAWLAYYRHNWSKKPERLTSSTYRLSK